MPANPDSEGKLPLIVGLCCLAAASVCLRFHLDFIAGVGYGLGLGCLVVWIRRRTRPASRD
jgi:hypothetical protein